MILRKYGRSNITNFKSYDELKIRLSMVLAGTTTVGNVTTLMEDEPVLSVTIDTKEEPAPTVTVNDEEDTMDYFQKLAEDDGVGIVQNQHGRM